MDCPLPLPSPLHAASFSPPIAACAFCSSRRIYFQRSLRIFCGCWASGSLFSFAECSLFLPPSLQPCSRRSASSRCTRAMRRTVRDTCCAAFAELPGSYLPCSHARSNCCSLQVRDRCRRRIARHRLVSLPSRSSRSARISSNSCSQTPTSAWQTHCDGQFERSPSCFGGAAFKH